MHGNASPHTANLTKVASATIGWEIIYNLPYSPDLAPSNFHLFGHKFETDEELKHSVRTGYAVTIKPSMLLATLTCQTKDAMC